MQSKSTEERPLLLPLQQQQQQASTIALCQIWKKAPPLAFLNNVPDERKWKLNYTGRYAEDIIAEAIRDCSYEHPCLSYILDLADPIWKKYITEAERKEIRFHNRPQMPSIDQDVQSYIDSFL